MHLVTSSNMTSSFLYVHLFLLQIHHLAVNSLLKSSQVDEMDGGSIGSFGNDVASDSHATETDFDDPSLCLPAFQVLKQLIQRCISDAVSSGNVFADAILQHLYRWLCRYELICLHLNQLVIVFLNPIVRTLHVLIRLFIQSTVETSRSIPPSPSS